MNNLINQLYFFKGSTITYSTTKGVWAVPDHQDHISINNPDKSFN